MLVIFLRIKCRMEFKPQRQLRSNVIKNALKTYVVRQLTSKYQVSAVRSFCVDGVSKEKIWITTFTGKFAGGQSICSLFFLLYNGTFRLSNKYRNISLDCV